MPSYYQEIIETIKEKKPSKKELNRLKTRLSGKHQLQKIPTDIDILLHADPAEIPSIKKYVLTKPVRTMSGVAVIAIMSKPYPCPHGKCTFCPGGPKSAFGDVPQSYTGHEPSTMRSMRNLYDAYLITMNRLEQYMVAGHVPDKVEVIIQGGTFPFYPEEYKVSFLRDMYQALNHFSRLFFDSGSFDIVKFKEFFELPGDIYDERRTQRIRERLLALKKKTSLAFEQKKNETSTLRCVGLTIETKPDYGKLVQGNEMLQLGCTRVELGVQTLYDDVLKKVNRGHTLADTVESIRILKDLGFKLNFHMMLGLPGVTRTMDRTALRQLFTDADYQPDMLKIYPCMVMKGTALFYQWKTGKYAPIETKEAAEIIAEFKQHIPTYCRVMRVQRDIPTKVTEAGVDRTNLRQYVDHITEKKGIHCQCIRCREPKDKKVNWKKLKINVTEYEASQGTEFFISADADDILLGYCRLRFPGQFLRKEIAKGSALIRELHTFGQAVALGREGEIQHKGIGKKLLKHAEAIARSHGKDTLVVISGIGVREYYRKLGYKREGPYMVKRV